MQATILKKGQNVDFPTYPAGNKTKLFVKNKSPKLEGEARVKVGWTPAETISVGPGSTAFIERDWANVVGNIFNMGRHDIEVWVV